MGWGRPPRGLLGLLPAGALNSTVATGPQNTERVKDSSVSDRQFGGETTILALMADDALTVFTSCLCVVRVGVTRPDVAVRHFAPDTGLKLDVGTERRYYDRAAVAVVAGIVDVLHARREVDSAPDVQRCSRTRGYFRGRR